MYKTIKDPFTHNEISIERLEDNAFIPFDPANTDYQQYLAWVVAGNVPAPADEGQ